MESFDMEHKNIKKTQIESYVRSEVQIEQTGAGGAGGAGSDTSNYCVVGQVVFEGKRYRAQRARRGGFLKKREEVISDLTEQIWQEKKPKKKRKSSKKSQGTLIKERKAREIKSLLKESRRKGINPGE